MGRPKDADALKTRATILREARAHLDADGLAAFSTREVARRVGISVGVVHYHFASRQGLVDAVLDVLYEEVAELAGRFRSTVRELPASDEALWELVMGSGYRFVREHVSLARTILMLVMASGALSVGRRRWIEQPWLASVGDVLAGRTGLPIVQVRLRLRSLVFLTARFAIADDQDMRELTEEEDAERRHAVVVEHLVGTALSYFGTSARR